jgi:hypothetical protein
MSFRSVAQTWLQEGFWGLRITARRCCSTGRSKWDEERLKNKIECETDCVHTGTLSVSPQCLINLLTYAIPLCRGRHLLPPLKIKEFWDRNFELLRKNSVHNRKEEAKGPQDCTDHTIINYIISRGQKIHSTKPKLWMYARQQWTALSPSPEVRLNGQRCKAQ